MFMILVIDHSLVRKHKRRNHLRKMLILPTLKVSKQSTALLAAVMSYTVLDLS